jgi:hypothetical protein
LSKQTIDKNKKPYHTNMNKNTIIEELESALSLVNWVKDHSFDFGAQTRAHHASEKISNAILSLEQDNVLKQEGFIDKE